VRTLTGAPRERPGEPPGGPGGVSVPRMNIAVIQMHLTAKHPSIVSRLGYWCSCWGLVVSQISVMLSEGASCAVC
jgi:hypothetical protein